MERADGRLPRYRGAGRPPRHPPGHALGGRPHRYFPTYALGNVIGAQLWERLLEDVPDVDERMARGEFAPIREWLREHVHRHGRKFLPSELLERVVGGPLDPQPYLRYLEGKLAVA